MEKLVIEPVVVVVVAVVVVVFESEGNEQGMTAHQVVEVEVAVQLPPLLEFELQILHESESGMVEEKEPRFEGE